MMSSSSNFPPSKPTTASSGSPEKIGLPSNAIVVETSTPASEAGTIAKNNAKTLNIMVVDDTSLFRRIMADALSAIANVTVLVKVNNGTECLEQLEHFSSPAAKAGIDVVFLDVEMPIMNGLETLRVIRNRYPNVLVVMVSGHNKSNVDITIEALALGAYDFIGKPEGASGEASQEQLHKELFVLIRSIMWQKSQEKLRARQQALGKSQSNRVGNTSEEFPSNTLLDAAYPVGQQHTVKPTLSASTTVKKNIGFEVTGASPKGGLLPTVNTTIAKANTPPSQATAKTPLGTNTLQEYKQPIRSASTHQTKPSNEELSVTGRTNKIKRLGVAPPLLLIGISTGGPAALMKFLPKLPANLGLPILIVQHMPPKFTRSLANSLDAVCGLTVKEAEHNERVNPNVVYIAPGGFHMEVESSGAGQLMVTLNQQPLVNSCRPSVDVLFKSAGEVCLSPPLSIIMTGMGKDGCDGVQYLKNARVGTYCITQTESSCVVYGMPKAVDTLQLSDESVPLEALAGRICELLGKNIT